MNADAFAEAPTKDGDFDFILSWEV